MGQSRFIDVEVTVTSTVMYRLPRPTKAEVVDAGHEWESDDPEGSIQSYLESEGIQDRIQGFRPINVTVEEMEIAEVMPAGKGLRPEEARPVFKLKSLIDGNESWLVSGRWEIVGKPISRMEPDGDKWSSELLRKLATAYRKFEAKKVVEKYSPGGLEHCPSISDIEMVPYQVKL